jgi:hypothetical protein
MCYSRDLQLSEFPETEIASVYIIEPGGNSTFHGGIVFFLPSIMD